MTNGFNWSALIIIGAEIILGIAILTPGIDSNTKAGAIGALAGSFSTRLALSPSAGLSS